MHTRNTHSLEHTTQDKNLRQGNGMIMMRTLATYDMFSRWAGSSDKQLAPSAMRIPILENEAYKV